MLSWLNELDLRRLFLYQNKSLKSLLADARTTLCALILMSYSLTRVTSQNSSISFISLNIPQKLFWNFSILLFHFLLFWVLCSGCHGGCHLSCNFFGFIFTFYVILFVCSPDAPVARVRSILPSAALSRNLYCTQTTVTTPL